MASLMSMFPNGSAGTPSSAPPSSPVFGQGSAATPASSTQQNPQMTLPPQPTSLSPSKPPVLGAINENSGGSSGGGMGGKMGMSALGGGSSGGSSGSSGYGQYIQMGEAIIPLIASMMQD